MIRLGHVLIDRDEYVAMEHDVRDEWIELPADRRPVARLADEGPPRKR